LAESLQNVIGFFPPLETVPDPHLKIQDFSRYLHYNEKVIPAKAGS